MAAKIPRKTAAEAGVGRRLSDLAYARVFEILFDRRLPAGAFVSQKELAALTGVPIGPLRDALRVLETEGVVTIHPRTGIQFVKLGLELTRSTYQFRGIIEAAGVATFAETATDATIDDLLGKHETAAASIKSEGLTERLQEDVEGLEQLLHSSFVASLNNPLINTSHRRIHNYVRMLRLDRRSTPSMILRSLAEHITILDACRRHDAAGAVAALQAHLGAALQRNMGLQ